MDSARQIRTPARAMGEAGAGTSRRAAEREATGAGSAAQQERSAAISRITSEPQRRGVRLAHRADFVDVAFRLGWLATSSRVTHPCREQALASARRQWSGADRPGRARRLLVCLRRRAEQGRPDRRRRRAHHVGRARRDRPCDPPWLDSTRSLARGFWPARDMGRARPRRSVRRQRLSGVQGDRGGRGADRDPHLFRLSAAHRAGGGGERPRTRHVARDRKSTRLNSSHLVISYAVFCLKKKTKTYYIHCFENIKLLPNTITY